MCTGFLAFFFLLFSSALFVLLWALSRLVEAESVSTRQCEREVRQHQHLYYSHLFFFLVASFDDTPL